jgi:Big-like domain-containing protein
LLFCRVRTAYRTTLEETMSGTRFFTAVAIAFAGLVQPEQVAASARPVLITHVVSPAVRDMPPQAHRPGPPEEIPRPHLPARHGSGDVMDPVVQTSTLTSAASQSLGQWEGLGEGYPGFTVTAAPPDPNIAVGPNHVVQWVNNAFVVFDKSGAQVAAPVSDGTFWGLLSTCNQLGGFSDPIVQYDRAADRWLVGEVAIPALPGLFGQFAQCFAVSTTSDPAGSYDMWAYGFGTTVPDYPKIAVWSDGYYVTWNLFQNGVTFTGAEACAWDRVAMLNGVAAPSFVCFKLSNAFASLLPSDLDGAAPPPVNSPNFLINVDPASSTLNLWRFHVDFANPGSSTFIGPMSIAGVAPFIAPCPDTQSCIQQPATTQLLDSLGDRLMYRLAYRNFGDHESLVANHTVVANTGGMVGVRWYEIRNPNSTPVIYQQGTFAPDTDNRWMASIAMDRSGNIGVGYSVSSSATFPSIRYTGWEVGDTLGTLQNETFLVSGGGSQTGYSRWGDYSAMRIDPSDDCTFWYTQEYQATTQTANWNTRVGSFRFPSCGQSVPAVTATTIASSSTTSTFGQSVTFTATVSPSAATGIVQFFDGENSLGAAPLSAGTASLATTTLAVGTHFISASYGGDAAFTGSTSSSLTHAVDPITTATALTSSLDPLTFGHAVTFTATVFPLTATGTVEFFDGSGSLGTAALSAGTASLTTTTLAVGTHFITASYSGDASFARSTSASLTQTVVAETVDTTTALTSSANPSEYGQLVTFTAIVSPQSGATGSVMFMEGSTTLGTGELNASGVAALSTLSLGVGAHSITAQYMGDSSHTGSTSPPLIQTVNKAGTTTTLTSSPNPSKSGKPVTFTATVSPSTVTGTVQFFDGSTSLGTANLIGGTATLSTSVLAGGKHSITATYSGDAKFAGSTSAVLIQSVTGRK